MRHTKAGNSAAKLTAALLAAALFAAALFGLPRSLRGETLTKKTEEAFVRYVQAREIAMDIELARRAGFLWIDALPEPQRHRFSADLRDGRVLIEQELANERPSNIPVPDGLIHDWTGIVFIAGASISDAVSVLQDYDRAAHYYSPQVVQSKLLQKTDDDFRVFLRLRQARVITVLFDTEYDVHYIFPDPAHAIAHSYSTRIAEIENAGKPNEHELPAGNDDGFLWRLYSYWRVYQSDSGVYLQCNAISLTRDVPIGLGWLVRPFLESIPRDSLRFTLESTRNAVLERVRNKRSPNTERQEN